MANRAVFLHISDLHLGDVDPDTLNAKAVNFCSYPVIAGLLGHSSRAMRYLERFHRKLRSEPVHLVVTGDLTAIGGAPQLEMAQQFLASYWEAPDLIVGMNQPRWNELAVPGNHDHWSGHRWKMMFGGPVPEMISTFSPLWERTEHHLQPLIGPAIPLDSGHRIRFFAMDTDADVRPVGWDRFRAMGAFESQIDALSAALDSGKRDPGKEIRVLLLHHSRRYEGQALSMKPASREALDRFILAHDIGVLLTGHTHEADLSVTRIADHESEALVLEACCGTTTQSIDKFRKFAERPGIEVVCPKVWRNSLLVHEIAVEKNEVYWTARVYELDTPNAAQKVLGIGSPGFETAKYLPDGGTVQCRHRVWPLQKYHILATTPSK